MVVIQSVATAEYNLFSEIALVGVLSGKKQLTWGKLVDGLAMVLKEVVREQRFEPFSARKYKYGWEAAEYRVYYGVADTASA